MSAELTGEICIGGTWRAGQGAAFTRTDPAKGETVWQGCAADAADVDAAVVAARGAFEDWAARPLDDRVAVIDRFAALLEARAEALAARIGQEMGKPLWDARTEVGAMAKKAGLSKQAYEARTGTHATPASLLVHRPHGVLAVFGPFNFPGHLPNGHILPALLAGNCVVFKPSEKTPGVAEVTVRLWQEAGLPDGVLSLVQGARDTGTALAGHEEIDGILFTGSVPTGQALHRQLAGRPDKILALELGGNNPFLVWEAGDLEAVARILVQSAFITSGQRCTCARRLILPEGAAGDAVLDALQGLMADIRLGPYDAEPQPFLGPLADKAAADGVMRGVAARLEMGGRWIGRPAAQDGAFVQPALIAMDAVASPPDEELFGPILQVYRADSFDRALALANDTKFGLAAGLLSDNEALWGAFHGRARAGIVNWNRPTTGASSAAPFGGIGLSGNHRPSAYYAADYCAYPVASLVSETLAAPDLPPGIGQ